MLTIILIASLPPIASKHSDYYRHGGICPRDQLREESQTREREPHDSSL
jgi:hypothetical protein